ncbi:MAG: hypothetical protein NC433_17710 [Clostridiales bacterium]|nr:hypothetical protein [Clostridiales bacterium]
MKDIIIMKEILAFLKRLKKFILENEKADIIEYLEILIRDLEKAIKENEKEENKNYDFEL